MTRPYKLLTADKEDDLIFVEKKLIPENSIRYKLYKFINNSKEKMTLNVIQSKILPDTTRRVVERALTDLYNRKLINRNRCVCGCSYIYEKI